MNILTIQNSPIDPLGVLENCILERQANLQILMPLKSDRLPTSPADYDGLIVLGGFMHAADDENFPYLKDVVALIQQFAQQQKPVLGVCLGAQLIARAFNQRVYRHHTLEIGFQPIATLPEAASDPLVGHISNYIHLMEWHYDTFDLPPEAVLLMSSDICPNQVYRIGESVYGFQCHLEVTRSTLQDWLREQDDYVRSTYPHLSEELAQQIEAYLAASEQFSRKVGHAWLDLVERRRNE